MSTLKEILTRRPVAATIRLTVPAGAARPAPPVGPGIGSVPAKSDGFLQGLQREDAEVQTGYADVGDDYGVQGQHIRVHGEVAVGVVVPEEGGGSGIREQPAGARDGVDGDADSRLRDSEGEAVGSVLPVHVIGEHL
ncbi:hypothetical protein Dsin_011238 [Dipteronia sinensis]|uniref:Uncharacterized protein n=1 Tax=Dipteronia sinensis TaxID=43782 RepID=A0AAE0EDB6_9ROSI|nr:hypothetical protein Dsin_011238 [Dipteronia sinensis]